jgi:hypothetical protein
MKVKLWHLLLVVGIFLVAAFFIFKKVKEGFADSGKQITPELTSAIVKSGSYTCPTKRINNKVVARSQCKILLDEKTSIPFKKPAKMPYTATLRNTITKESTRVILNKGMERVAQVIQNTGGVIETTEKLPTSKTQVIIKPVSVEKIDE